MKNVMLSFVLLLSAQSCTSPVREDAQKINPGNFEMLKQADWLIGAWENRSKEGYLIETWTRQNDSSYAATSCFITGKDTAFSEKIEIMQSGRELLYIPTVKDQNKALPVKFTLTSATNDQLVFENPAHDFPQKITYTKFPNDSLLAEISGSKNGKERSQSFPMKRVKK